MQGLYTSKHIERVIKSQQTTAFLVWGIMPQSHFFVYTNLAHQINFTLLPPSVGSI